MANRMSACGALFAALTAALVVAPAPAYYPRATVTASGEALAVVERPNAAMPHRLGLLRRTSLSPETWMDAATVESDTRSGVDLANGFLWQERTGGALLCAYRHHTDVGTPAVVYRIALSSSADEGVTWTPLANITQGPIGVWEPLLFSTPTDPPGTVRVLYSAELTNGGEQDIVQQTSRDGGATWGAVDSRVHTAGSRNGMPGVAVGPDGSLVLVFEGFWSGQWGHFTVNSVRSFDGGVTWVQPQIVHAPSLTATCNGVPCCAGSPQIGQCGSSVAVVYMSNEDHPGGGQPVPWPGGAGVGLITASFSSTNVSAPLEWAASPPSFPPLLSPSALWPSIFTDGPYLRLAYQTNGGAAALSTRGQGSLPACSLSRPLPLLALSTGSA
jgi:hypothetical protein